MACENSDEEIQALSSKRVAVEEALQIESYLSQGGQMRARLTAPVMNRYQTDSPYIEFPRTLHVDFFEDSSLVVESQLDAKYGRYKEAEDKVFLRDSVRVFNLKKDTLKCQELWWDQEKELFYTDKPVEIHQPDKIIFGNGLEADQSFKWWVIRQVTGELLVPRGGFNTSAGTDTSGAAVVDGGKAPGVGGVGGAGGVGVAGGAGGVGGAGVPAGTDSIANRAPVRPVPRMRSPIDSAREAQRRRADSMKAKQ